MIEIKHKWLDKVDITKEEISKMKRHHDALIKTQYPTTQVVKAIVHAVESPNPKTIYITLAAQYWLITKLSKFMPDKLKDFILAARAR